MFNLIDCILLFIEIVFILSYVYLKGYFYNDVKVNNVVLERKFDFVKYDLIFIDFGKSIKLGLLFLKWSLFCFLRKIYLVLEV